MHGTTLHLFVILFSVQYMEKRFALETRASRHLSKREKKIIAQNSFLFCFSWCGRPPKKQKIAQK